MSYDTHAALERLEKNLAAVDSARKQVTQTVESSQQLQQVVKDYSSSLNDLQTTVNGFVEELRSYQTLRLSDFNQMVTQIHDACTRVIDEYDKAVVLMQDQFKTQLADQLSNLADGNAKLSEHVGRLNELYEAINLATAHVAAVREKLDHLAQELTDSQANQDQVLSDIASNIKEANSSQTKILNQLSDDLKSSQKAQDDDLLEIKQKVVVLSDNQTKHDAKLEKAIGDIAKLAEQLSGVKVDVTNVKSDVSNVTADVANVKSDVLNSKLSIETRIANADTQIANVATKVASLEPRIAAVESKLTTVEAKLTTALSGIGVVKILGIINLVAIIAAIVVSFIK